MRLPSALLGTAGVLATWAAARRVALSGRRAGRGPHPGHQLRVDACRDERPRRHGARRAPGASPHDLVRRAGAARRPPRVSSWPSRSRRRRSARLAKGPVALVLPALAVGATPRAARSPYGNARAPPTDDARRRRRVRRALVRRRLRTRGLGVRRRRGAREPSSLPRHGRGGDRACARRRRISWCSASSASSPGRRSRRSRSRRGSRRRRRWPPPGPSPAPSSSRSRRRSGASICCRSIPRSRS
jgi:hypothetical protein